MADVVGELQGEGHDRPCDSKRRKKKIKNKIDNFCDLFL
ncbi:Hypothetical protein Minf_2106 [Methylacidiphilum infernorum V4]|uniref:Uncharacterized protein n=1 Tax=Methylacidiphilum infernorum (isolate V4) TaxID=481448 RepID=B3DZ68_METI4|nr:Hypothetical protein Minf_2106 [Methylacidiphilum infernorum V4]